MDKADDTTNVSLGGQASDFSPTQLEVHPASPINKRFGKEFLTAFITIFLAELGDKTQLSTLLMTAESHAPWLIFMGAAAALVATSLVGVLLGRWLAQRLSAEVLNTVTGASLLLISVLLLWDAVHV